MSASRTSSSSAGDTKVILAKIRQHVAKGTTEKLLEDENFVFHMLKLMIEDAVDPGTKAEFLRVLEDCDGDILDPKSIDEVTSTLFGIFRQYQGHDDCVSFLTQLLITATTLLVSCREVPADPIASLVEILWGVAAKVNDVNHRRLRAVACQCMAQLEEYAPGVIWKWQDRLLQAVKQDRSDVCQDYVTLLTTVLYHMTGDILSPDCPITPDITPRLSVVLMDIGICYMYPKEDLIWKRIDSSFDQSVSGYTSEILSSVSFIMEHSSVFTPAGLCDIITSITGIVHNTPGISPSIFKPLMLHHMATQDPCLLHIILFLQKEFPGEILTASEEKLLLTRLMTTVNQRSINPAHRLLCLQWLIGYCQLEDKDSTVLDYVKDKLAPRLHPAVFDSIDMHVGKVLMLNTSIKPQTLTETKDITTLMSSLNYLKKLTVSTGQNKVAVSLYRSLYNIEIKHCTDSVSRNIIMICQSVLNSYPKLIPLVLDFLLCIRDQAADSVVYMNILSSLHKQVLSSTPEDVLRQFEFYLLVLKASAKETEINPLTTLKYLLSLTECAVSVDRCSWRLGNAVLGVCRSILLHHSTEGIFTELGDLLHETMLHYMDIDIQDKARFYYALLTGASDKKIREVLSDAMQGGNMTEQSFSSLLPGSLNQPMRTELHQVHQPVLKWERITLTPVFTAKSKTSGYKDIAQYRKSLEHLTITLQIKHRLQMLHSSEFDMLFALSVKVDTNKSYRQLKDIHVACMNRNDEKELNVELQPSLPQPATFTTSAMFASVKNDTYICCLPNTDVSFVDLLLPFPWEHIGIPEHDREDFFFNLWNQITGCTDPSEGIESVKVVSCPLKRLQSEWKIYQLSKDSCCFLIFLPAKYHLLFKVQERQDNIVVSLATDNWKILPHINDYLNSFDS